MRDTLKSFEKELEETLALMKSDWVIQCRGGRDTVSATIFGGIRGRLDCMADLAEKLYLPDEFIERVRRIRSEL